MGPYESNEKSIKQLYNLCPTTNIKKVPAYMLYTRQTMNITSKNKFPNLKKDKFLIYEGYQNKEDG